MSIGEVGRADDENLKDPIELKGIYHVNERYNENGTNRARLVKQTNQFQNFISFALNVNDQVRQFNKRY